jgi:hypothetical protein
LLGVLDLDEPELADARERSARISEELVDAAHRAGVLRKDVVFGDVGLMLVRLSRPLPGPIPESTQAALAHRHADLFLAGLRVDPSAEPLGGPALQRVDLEWFRRGTRGAARG